MPLHVTPLIPRGLLTVAASATLLLGGAASAVAQTDEELTPITVVIESQLTLSPPISPGDLTGEGALHIDAPVNPVSIEPAPVAVPPQSEIDLPNRAPNVGLITGYWLDDTISTAAGRARADR